MTSSSGTPLDRALERANALVAGRSDLGLERRDDGWIVRPCSAPMIQVFGSHTYLIAPSEAEREAAAALGVRSAAGSGPLKVSAGSKAELALVAERLASARTAQRRRAAPATATAPSRPANEAEKNGPARPAPNLKAAQPEQPKKKQKNKKQKAGARAKVAQTGVPRRKLNRKQKAELHLQADEMAAFFRAAGIEASVQNEQLVVNGRKVVALHALWGLRLRELDQLRDRIAAAACSQQFIEAMKRNGSSLGDHLRAYYVREQRGFEIRNGDHAIALICAGAGHVYGGGVIDGNFLADGEHWEKLRSSIARQEARQAQEAESPANDDSPPPVAQIAARASRRSNRIDDVPAGLPPELVAAVLEASKKIRLERRLAYDRPVTLECELGELVLSPIVGNPDYLRVPFVLERRGDRVQGDIVLTGRRDPVPVHIDDEAAGSLLASVWAAALLGLADATCFDIHQPERRPPGAGSRSSSRRRGGGRHSFRAIPGSTSRRGIWPDHLRPVGQWARYSGAFVGGHRRRLHEGHSASAEALENARHVGIVLRPGETWVRPHARGLPSNLAIRFRWHAYEPLLAAAGVRRGRG